MELLDGQPLNAILTAHPLETPVLLDLAIQIADGLDAAHARGIVHRDVKPPNLFVTRRGQLKILDFGIAVLGQAGSSPSDGGSGAPQWGGTLPYMSPEQIRGGALDPRSDLFSLGCVIYEMATGRRAFGGTDMAQVATAILVEPPARPSTINPAIPASLDRIIMGALEQDRALRCQTAADVRSDLQRVKRDVEAAAIIALSANRAASVAATRRTAASRRRSTAVIVVVGACAVTALTVLGAPAFQRMAAPVSTTEPPVPAAPAPRTSHVPAIAESRAVSKFPSEPAAPTPAPRSPEPAALVPLVAPLGLPAAAPAAPPVAIVEPPPPRPPSIEPDLRLARAQADHKLYDQALSTLAEAISRDGMSATAVDAYFLIASIQEKQQKIDDARATYVLIGDRFRGGSRADEAMFALAQSTLRARRDDREVEAHAILGRLIERSPRGAWALRALMARADVEERKRMHQFDEELGTIVPSALVTYRQVIERDGSFPEREHALWKAGELYERAKRYYLAARSFSTLAEQYPETGYDAWAAAARVYDRRLKDSAQARAAYARVPSSSPSFKEAQKFLER
jgi:hypothetical protein